MIIANIFVNIILKGNSAYSSYPASVIIKI